MPESLTLTSPNGGENLVSGNAYKVTWASNGNPKAYVKIELVKPGALNKVIASSAPNNGSYLWTIPMTQPLGSDYRLRITRTTYPAGSKPANDTSNNSFSLIPETLSLMSPDGGQSWVGGSSHEITWASTGSPKAYVKIELVKPGVANRVIVGSTPNDGVYDWTIPMTQPLGSDYTVKITRTTFSTGSTAATDSSNAVFALISETLTVTYPNGGEEWVGGTTNSITWTSTGSPTAYVKIELVKPGVLNRGIISSTLNDGSYDWVIPMTQALGSDYSVKITRTTFPTGSTAATDYSDEYFSIAPEELAVTSPNGGESWVRGTVHGITWVTTGSSNAYVRIELLKGGELRRVIASSALNKGTYSWAIPAALALGVDYSVRVTRTSGFRVGDSSDAYFSVVS